MASRPQGSLYCGSTSILLQRAYQHKEGVVDGFTKLYKIHKLVWFEEHTDMSAMITRERQIKKWNREWKVRLS
jgi:putative endonuclease